VMSQFLPSPRMGAGSLQFISCTVSIDLNFKNAVLFDHTHTTHDTVNTNNIIDSKGGRRKDKEIRKDKRDGKK
jgi:hypothetical protein